MQRTLVELVAALRRGGLHVSPAETLDAFRALSVVGVERRGDVRAALSCTLLRRGSERERFERLVDAFLEARGRQHGDLYVRLRAQGFSAEELATLKSVLGALAGGPAAALGAVVQGPPALGSLLDVALAGLPRAWIDDPARQGLAAMRALEAVELPRARRQLGALHTALGGALGERGEALAEALSKEIQALPSAARARLAEARQRPEELSLSSTQFEQLSPEQLQRVEALVQQLAERLLASQRVRERRARAGRLDGRATLRRALATAGVPASPQYLRARPRRSSLFVLCDISDSVRTTARLSLSFLHVAQRVFGTVRSFVFVSDVGETTALFERRPVGEAIQRAYQGEVVSVSDNSHYGRVLARFEQLTWGQLSSRDTLLIIGDARTNHLPCGDEVLARLGRRVGRVLWFNPEPPTRWTFGDSAMGLYQRLVDGAYPVCDLRHFEAAVRALSR